MSRSESLCPGARNLSFSVAHELRCCACGHVTQGTELHNHLSLDLPPHGAGGVVPVESLLSSFFAPETVAKDCDRCGAQRGEHALRRTLSTLPRVLVLHLKRFRAEESMALNSQDELVAQMSLRKANGRVRPAPQLDLAAFEMAGCVPCLPLLIG